MDKGPYKAYNDGALFSLLKALHRDSIHPSHIETDGALLVQVSSVYDLDVKVDVYIDEEGIAFSGRKDVFSELKVSNRTLMQLAAMAVCFAAGHAKARQEAAEAECDRLNDEWQAKACRSDEGKEEA